MKLDAVEYWTERVPLTRPYTIAYDRIDSVQLAFVRVQTAGHIGLGCASPIPEVSGETFADCLSALEVGRHALLAGEDWAALLRTAPAAQAAYDMALLDLQSRLASRSLVDHLGRAHSELATSITIGIKDRLDEVLAEADEYYGRGFRILKVKIGLDIEQDLERIHRLRERFGAAVRLRIDANQGYRAEQLGRLFSTADALGVEFIEQPLPPARNSDLAILTPAQRGKLALDESLLSIDDAYNLVSPNIQCGIFNIKLMKSGGITNALGIARIAAANGVDLMWGCSDESCIGIAAALHAAFASPATRYLDLDGHLDLARDPARGGFTIEQGVMRLTDAHGLGVTLADGN
jgi:L-alanine-DL-glutamate epimerase-like enolase superfamily enzyme